MDNLVVGFPVPEPSIMAFEVASLSIWYLFVQRKPKGTSPCAAIESNQEMNPLRKKTPSYRCKK